MPWLLLVLVAGPEVLVNSTPATCPDRVAIETALRALRPQAVAGAPGRPEANGLVLVVSELPDDRLLVRVVGPDGNIRLARDLQMTPSSGASDCRARADTVALIVDRYLRELPLPPAAAEPAVAAAPSPPPALRSPPARSSEVAAGVQLRLPDHALGALAAGLACGSGPAAERSGFVARATAGLVAPVSLGYDGGEAKLTRWSVGLELGWRRPLGSSRAAEVLAVGQLERWQLDDAPQGDSTRSVDRWTPVFGIALAGRQRLSARTFARAALATEVVTWRYPITHAPSVLFDGPRVRVTGSLQLGAWF